MKIARFMSAALVLTTSLALSRPAEAADPVTFWHYAPNSNFSGQGYNIDGPGTLGFNLADVSSVSLLQYVPAGVKAMVFIGTCNGADSTFKALVDSYAASTYVGKIFGFYLMDEASPSTCSASHLDDEADYVHQKVPGSVAFIEIANAGTGASPSFPTDYAAIMDDIDAVGFIAFPARSELSGGFDATYVDKIVNAAVAAGYDTGKMVPLYQAFGCTSTGTLCSDDGGGYFAIPTATQMASILTEWGKFVINPPFDYAFTWGNVGNETGLQNLSSLQNVFGSTTSGHNYLAKNGSF